MNKTTRTLAMTGMAVITGSVLGIGPATAAPSTTQGTGASTQGAQDQAASPRHLIQDYYRSYRQCVWAGVRGEDRGRWDDYDCYRVRWGHWRGWWALDVRWDRYHHDNNNNDHHGGNNGGDHGGNNNDHHGGNNGGDHGGNNNDHHGGGHGGNHDYGS